MTIGFIIISAILIIAVTYYVKRVRSESDSELTETEKKSKRKQREKEHGDL